MPQAVRSDGVADEPPFDRLRVRLRDGTGSPPGALGRTPGDAWQGSTRGSWRPAAARSASACQCSTGAEASSSHGRARRIGRWRQRRPPHLALAALHAATERHRHELRAQADAERGQVRRGAASPARRARRRGTGSGRRRRRRWARRAPRPARLARRGRASSTPTSRYRTVKPCAVSSSSHTPRSSKATNRTTSHRMRPGYPRPRPPAGPAATRRGRAEAPWPSTLGGWHI